MFSVKDLYCDGRKKFIGKCALGGEDHMADIICVECLKKNG